VRAGRCQAARGTCPAGLSATRPIPGGWRRASSAAQSGRKIEVIGLAGFSCRRRYTAGCPAG
jgi:hypothetical protein